MSEQGTHFEPIYIVDGARTPFLKARNRPGPFSAADLALQAGRALLLRQPFAPDKIDEVILGCAAPSPEESNIARVVALRLGLPDTVPAWTVMRNCASGMQALDSAISDLRLGRADCVLAGGVDALSRAPLLLTDELVGWLARWKAAREAAARLRLLAALRPRMFVPVIGLLKGLSDPNVGLSMGQTAENVAHLFGIDRQAMDAYADRSHARAWQARDRLAQTEIAALTGNDAQGYAHDDGVREDSSEAALRKLRPAFDRPYGNITAGNSSQVTDGAALLLLASGDALKRLGLKPLARIIDTQWAALDPAYMGLGPVHAATPILLRRSLTLDDIDLWEINEAFAAQVLGCVSAWNDEAYCQRHFRHAAFGRIDESRLNIDGGAIALGHPVGASGARIVLHLVHALKRRGARRGMAAICIGGGQGGAMLIETVEDEEFA